MEARRHVQQLLKLTTPDESRNSALLNAHVILGSITFAAILLGPGFTALTGIGGGGHWIGSAAIVLWVAAVFVAAIWALSSVRPPRPVKDPSLLGYRLVATGRFARGAALVAVGAWAGIYMQTAGEYLKAAQVGGDYPTFFSEAQASFGLVLGLLILFAPLAVLYVGLTLAFDMLRVGERGRLRAAGTARAVMALLPWRFCRSRVGKMVPLWILYLCHPASVSVASMFGFVMMHSWIN
jgi:hypothetical protein